MRWSFFTTHLVELTGARDKFCYKCYRAKCRKFIKLTSTLQ
ncbi:hypothetical protein J2Y67_005690, partial [Neobacillus niacini]|nr:hypothetical protein [Neobacillus niacini]